MRAISAIIMCKFFLISWIILREVSDKSLTVTYGKFQMQSFLYQFAKNTFTSLIIWLHKKIIDDQWFEVVTIII